ncbi:cell wall glycosyl hydrolase YteR [Pestalotiopsis sp. NC0098]|nr:cell wall glycosyl hydrolase YteR [Pestalotiopsis sp. NC0098]
MKTSALSFLSLGAASVAAQTSYLARFADSFIRRGVEYDFGYTAATLYLGYEAAYELTKNETFYDWYHDQIDGVVADDGTIVDWNYSFHSLDEYRMGNNYLYWYNETGEEKYKSAAAIVRNQLNAHPRTPTGGFWHREPTYPNQMWLDGIFMADSFYAKWTSWFDADNTTAWDDILSQYDHIEAHCRNTTSGLLVHGYDESFKAVWANPVTGAAPLVWDRAVGWYFLSLWEALQVFPESHAGYQKLLGYFTTLAAALKKTQDEASGGWWLIMSEPYPGAAGNYIESSASAMFVLGLLRGVRSGYLASAEYLAPAQTGYEALVDRFVVENADGTLDWEGTVEVGSLGSNGTYEYYISVPLATNDYKGAGPFMLASYEWESWASSA